MIMEIPTEKSISDIPYLPEELVVTAESEDGEVMALEHKEYSIFGLQFHPESVMTPDGKTMIENFMKVIRDR